MKPESTKAIRKWRIDKDKSLRAFASDLGCSSAYVSAIELGKKSVTEGYIEKLIKTFGVEVKPYIIELIREKRKSNELKIQSLNERLSRHIRGSE